MAFTVDIRGNASHLEKAIGLAKNKLGDLANSAKFGVTALAGIGAAGAAGLGAFIISSSKAASNVESLAMQFETLLGSTGAAKDRMEEIVKFAASTPFEIAELAATSKLLQTMGGTLLATGEGLRMVGDAASISGQPLQEVGLHIGRLFNAITSGTSAGESVARLQELGLMTGTVKREFEALAASQKKGETASLTQQQAMAKLREVFKSTAGAMERLAATTEGKMSNMKDNVTSLQVAFGTGFNVGLKDALDSTNTFLPQIQDKLKTAGSVIGGTISQAVQGNTEELAALGGFIGEIVFAGFKAAYLKQYDELLAGLQNMATVDPAGFKIFSNFIAEKMGQKPRFDISPKVESASLTSYLQSAIEEVGQSKNLQTLKNADIQRQIEIGTKNGIDASMSEAVKKGVLEAMSRQPGGAKFSN
jgi:hypothetical protein